MDRAGKNLKDAGEPSQNDSLRTTVSLRGRVENHVTLHTVVTVANLRAISHLDFGNMMVIFIFNTHTYEHEETDITA